MSKTITVDGGEMEKEYKNFHQLHEGYCCIDLLRAVKAKIFSEVVSGILFYDKNHSGCGGEVRIQFCPFCGAKIITERTKIGWTWKTRSITSCPNQDLPSE